MEVGIEQLLEVVNQVARLREGEEAPKELLKAAREAWNEAYSATMTENLVGYKWCPCCGNELQNKWDAVHGVPYLFQTCGLCGWEDDVELPSSDDDPANSVPRRTI